MVVVLLVILVLVEDEVEDANGVDGFQPKAPLPLLTLLADGERRVVDATILEPLLVGLLHLDDDFLAFFVFAINVEHRAAVVLGVAQLFGGQQRQ